MRGRVIILLAAVLLAGCTGTAPRSSASATSAAPSSAGSDVLEGQTLRCAGAIDGHPPPADFEVVLGAVALPASPRSRALQVAESGGGFNVPALFAKTGLVIRAGVPLQLQVTGPAGDRVGIGWGSPAGPTRRVEVAACPDARGSGWLAYPGGYWADRPLCLALVVRSAGREQRVHIGIGQACPGQQPPVTP